MIWDALYEKYKFLTSFISILNPGLNIPYVGGIVERIIAELTPTNLAPGYSQSTPTRDQPVLIQAQTGGTQENDLKEFFLKIFHFKSKNL